MIISGIYKIINIETKDFYVGFLKIYEKDGHNTNQI